MAVKVFKLVNILKDHLKIGAADKSIFCREHVFPERKIKRGPD
jgi:hypothetical protein